MDGGHFVKLQTKFRKAAFLAEENGHYRQLTRHFAAFFRRSNRLVVTFDHMQSRDNPAPRFPWCFDLLEARGVSHLGIMMSRRNDWFRHRDLFDYFDMLAAEGFFDQFEDVLFYGSSMGGFGACAYAAAAPGARILALIPQSTLALDLAPFELRYAKGYARGDWDDPRYRDGAAGVAAASHAQIVYDPYFAEDRVHADRLQGPNVQHLKAFFAGHKATRALQFGGILGPLLDSALDGAPMAERAFYDAYRAARRTAPWHMRNLALRSYECGSKLRLRRVLDAAGVQTDEVYPRFWQLHDEMAG